MFKQLHHLFAVRESLENYQRYIAQLNLALRIAGDKNADLRAENLRLRDELTAARLLIESDGVIAHVDESHLQRENKRLAKALERKEARISELESEVEELELEIEDAYEPDEVESDIIEADEDLLNTLEEAGIDPSRHYSVGELLDIKAALATVRIAG